MQDKGCWEMCSIHERQFIHSICQLLTWVTSFAASEAESGTSGHSVQVFYLQSNNRITEECVYIQESRHMQGWCFAFVCACMLYSPCHYHKNWNLATQSRIINLLGQTTASLHPEKKDDTASVSFMSTYSCRYFIQQGLWRLYNISPDPTHSGQDHGNWAHHEKHTQKY